MKFKNHCPAHVLAVFTLSSLIQPLSAAPITWDGDTDTDFTNGSNWVGDAAPADDLITDVATFLGASTFQPDVSAARSVNGLDFQSGGWTLSGAGALSVGAGGITSTGSNAITGPLIQSGNANYSSAAGGNLELNTISGGTVTFGTGSNTGSVTLSGGADNPSFSPVVAFGSVILNKTGSSGSSTNNVTVDAGANLQFGSNLTSRSSGGGRGQIYGTATVNGTLNLNGQGLTSADTNNWIMGGLSGSGTVTNNGTGSAQIGIKGGVFSGSLTDGTNTTALLINDGTFTFNSGASNTYSGGTTVDGAEVRMAGTGGLLGTGDVTLLNGAKLKNNNSRPNITNNIILGAGGGSIEAGWNNRNIDVNGTISGSGSLAITNDSSAVRMDGGNTYTGGTEVQGYAMTKTGAFGTGAVTLNDIHGERGGIQNWEGLATHNNDLVVSANGGRLKAGWNNNLVFTGVTSGAGELTIQQDSGYVVLSHGENTYSGDIVFEGGNSRLRVGSLESGNYTGKITGNGTIDFAGSGTQILASSSVTAHTGSTTVSDTMTLQVDGDLSSSQIFVRDGATVSGIGTLGVTTIEAGGTIAPGQSPGVISTANFTLASLATYAAEIDGTTAGSGHDQIAVTGTVTLDGTLNAILTGSYVFGDEVILIDNDGADAIVGTFTGLNEGDTAIVYGGYDWIALYGAGDGNDFALRAVPEPSSALLAGLGALALLRRRRRA